MEVEVYDDVYDQEYVMILSEIDTRLNTLRKHDRVRIVAWIKKLNMITTNKMWKKNRNLYSFLILDMILKNEFEEPINKFPPEGHLSVLSQTATKTRLSNNISKALPPTRTQFKTMDSVNNNNLNQNDSNKEQNSNSNTNNPDFNINNNNVILQDNKQTVVYDIKSSEGKNYSNDFNNNEREEHKNINQIASSESKYNEDKLNKISSNNLQEINNEDDTMKFTFMNPKDKLNYLNKLLEAKNNEIDILSAERNILIGEIQLLESQINSENNSNDKATTTKLRQNGGKEKLGQVKGSIGKIPNRHYFISTNNANKDKSVKK